jgi:hypothetical protein
VSVPWTYTKDEVDNESIFIMLTNLISLDSAHADDDDDDVRIVEKKSHIVKIIHTHAI